MPEMPDPSSMHVDEGERRPDLNSMLVGEAIQDAKWGVTAQTTVTC
jgi:hypothetical protein